MPEITAALVKELREKTGAGMMDCKRALTEAGGDMEAAVDWLRTKGLAAAAKKSGRVAAEGLVGVVSVARPRGDGGGERRDRLRRPQRDASRPSSGGDADRAHGRRGSRCDQGGAVSGLRPHAWPTN